jgi:hypothetical protein
MSSGLVIVGDIEIILPLIAALMFGSISLLAMVLDPVVSVSVADDIPKVSHTMTLAVLI